MRKQASKKHKNIWQIQEAKAKFSQVVTEANSRGCQIITKQGEPIAVLLSKKDFDEMTKSKTSLLDLFQNAPCQDIELDIRRSKDLPREFYL